MSEAFFKGCGGNANENLFGVLSSINDKISVFLSFIDDRIGLRRSQIIL